MVEGGNPLARWAPGRRWASGTRRSPGVPRYSCTLLLAGAVIAGGCGVRSAAADLYPDVAEHSGRRIDDVRFVDPEPFNRDTLLTVIQTQPSRCSFLGLPVCVPFTRIGRQEHRLSVARVSADVEALERFYRIAGYFGTRVAPRVEEDGSDVDVYFTVRRGNPIVLDYLSVGGTEGIMDPDSLAGRLPLQPGDIFHLGRFIESSDIVLRGLQRRGHAYAEILRSFAVDTVDSRAEASIDAIPGPRVTVDSILVRGAAHLGRTATLRQLEIAEGDLLVSSALLESQRNLYALELVSLASVTLAPDSLQAAPQDSTTATVMVSITEAPVHEIEAAVGFGTEECLRTDGRWVNRSFGGGARRLSLRASLSRLGVGEPFAVGAGRSVCPGLVGDTIFGGNTFDYRFSADLTQPYFMGPRNQLGVNAYAERLSEPGVFSRNAVGGRTSVSRRLGARSGGSFSVEVESARTRASPALFCAAFLVCEPATIEELSQRRFRSELGTSYFLDASNNRLEPTAGFVVRTTGTYAAPWLGSQLNFFRWTADGSYYRELKPRYVTAFALRLGNFFRTATLDPSRGQFLPPEDRFYAGGASTVRGYTRNTLGPGVYVAEPDWLEIDEAGDTTFSKTPHFVPTGGTSLVIANAELRMPSPFLARLLRLALFVDAGAIGTGSVWDLDPGEWRLTPGAGIRLQTPVGPVRLDMAFNPYDEPVAPVLLNDVETGRLRRIKTEYQAPSGNFFSRLRIHLGVGHAF
jgi:outer membrane protein insertion porin family